MTMEKARTNYIFVDYENVQAIDLDLIAGKPVKVFLIVGNRRKTFPTSLAKQMLKFSNQVTWIDSEGATSNALNLVLAYHVGQQVKADPEGYFHILAKDQDYDALIKHLRANGVRAIRDEEFSEIAVFVDFKRLSLGERVEKVVERFQRNHVSRPTREKSLLATIHAFCRKELPPEEVQQIANAMVAKKLIEFTPQKGVVYKLAAPTQVPSSPKTPGAAKSSG